ncbi:MAG TPA: NAD-dependent epimerase/dehydratase family protein [Ktedonobacteraceae bacterium]|jgi:dTDP-glucose 4,6-dehydratase|nr:NAD-dependent epimerase/dehydratase family protein [Ktedonobacteraceae bacterium]
MQPAIVVTGGAGFVGVNLIQYACTKGYRVIIIDTKDRLHRLESMGIFPSSQLIFSALNLAERHFSLEEDIDALIHLAALPQVDYSLYYPARVASNNFEAIVNMLEFVRERKIPILFTSSVEIYGGNGGALLCEEDAYNPLSPYAASKMAGEGLLRSYRASLGVTGSIARLTNLYGPWQAPDRIIPRLITQILSDYPCEVDGGRLRDFLYVEDAVTALLSIVEHALWGETFNIASGHGYDNFQVLSLLEKVAGKAIQASYSDKKRGDGRGEALIASSEKLQKAVAWRPSTPLQEGLKLTYDWYASHMDWWKQFDQNIRSDRMGPQFLTDHTYDL